MIKGFILLFISLSLTFISTQCFGQKIVQYYELLAKYDHDIALYPLQKNAEGKWISTTPKGHHVTPKIEDNANFIEIVDKNSKDHFTIEVSLFERDGQTPVIAVVKNHYDIFLHGEVHFLELHRDNFKDITDQLIPDITYRDFQSQTSKHSASLYNKEFNHHLEFGYELPHKGTMFVAKMQTETLKEKCKSGGRSLRDYCAELGTIKYSNIELVWDKSSGKFKIGKKS